MNALILVTSILFGGYLIFSKRLVGSSKWKATVTPLASIMGSGFLVSAPLLAGIVGNLAVFCMATLLVLAFLVGGAIRFNIRHFEPIENEQGSAQKIAFISRIVLAGAYFISVSYYLQLLAVFLLNAFHFESDIAAKIITSSFLAVIGIVGMWKGLSVLEQVEKYAVGFNLGMIGALLLGLLVYNINLILNGSWALAPISSEIDLHDLRVLLGLLIVVQGFETSRYLGNGHPAEERIKTMRTAQLLSAAIYLVFISLTTVLFHEGLGSDVTAIIKMTHPVATILPILLTIAAIGSQFSAAVADNEGAGGLIEDISHKKVPPKYAYFLILVVTIGLTWETNVNEIISYASRAFALYYMFQCLVALLTTLALKKVQHRVARVWGYGFLATLCFLVFAVGLPSG